MRHAEHDYRQADLTPAVLGLCEFAVKLTREPAAVALADADALRELGWNDPAIHDAIQVIAYFNYINRVAEGVGIGAEPEWGPEWKDRT